MRLTNALYVGVFMSRHIVCTTLCAAEGAGGDGVTSEVGTVVVGGVGSWE